MTFQAHQSHQIGSYVPATYGTLPCLRVGASSFERTGPRAVQTACVEVTPSAGVRGEQYMGMRGSEQVAACALCRPSPSSPQSTQHRTDRQRAEQPRHAMTGTDARARARRRRQSGPENRTAR